MFDKRDDLTIPLDGIDTARLLEFWRWLLPDDFRPWFVTALGDLFLRGSDGKVWWLDVGSGELQIVADNEEEFRTLLRDSDNVDLWFGAPLADLLSASGVRRGPQECYSYMQLPIFGGGFKPANFRVYDVATHFRVWGPIHEKIKDLPDGASVEFHTTE